MKRNQTILLWVEYQHSNSIVLFVALSRQQAVLWSRCFFLGQSKRLTYIVSKLESDASAFGTMKLNVLQELVV